MGGNEVAGLGGAERPHRVGRYAEELLRAIEDGRELPEPPIDERALREAEKVLNNAHKAILWREVGVRIDERALTEAAEVVTNAHETQQRRQELEVRRALREAQERAREAQERAREPKRGAGEND